MARYVRALCLVLVILTTVHATPDTLTGLVVVHRHGARVTTPPANDSVICGNSCGQLTEPGADMLFSLGQRMRTDYPDFPWDSRSAQHTQQSKYNPNRIVSSSTDVDRTLQSSAAFLRGLFAPSRGNTTADCGNSPSVGLNLPAIHTVAVSDSKDMLPTDSWTNLLLLGLLNASSAKFPNEFANTVFTREELVHIGRESNLEGICFPDQAFNCVIGAQDQVAAALANGYRVSPYLVSIQERLNSVCAYDGFITYFQPWVNPAFAAAIGAFGYPLAMEIVQTLQSGSVDAPVFHEFSGHDVTVMPLAAIIGNLRIDRPLFAAAFVIEQWSSGTVKIRYGEPNQTFASSHEYAFRDVTLTCINSTTGAAYEAPQGCPLSDWNGYLQTRGPIGGYPAGMQWCYVEPDLLQLMDCLPGNSTTDAKKLPPGPYCQFYRQQCPTVACGVPGNMTAVPSHYLTPDYICHSLHHSH